MSRPIGVIIFDRDEGQLARRVERVTAERAARDDPDEFRIIGASRRCELLLEADRLPSSVALIDLRADDRDIQARGFGPIETVRRHARLSRRCRPVAWTAWSSHLTADWARRVGAYALVDHDLVFRGEASVLGLVTRVSRQAAVPISEQITFEYHTFSRASPEEEERARWERQERVLGEPWQPGDEELLPRIALLSLIHI